MRSGLLLSRMSGGDRKDGRISRDFFCVGRSTGGEFLRGPTWMSQPPALFSEQRNNTVNYGSPAGCLRCRHRLKWPGPASVVAQRVWNLALVAPYQRQHDEDPVAGPVSCYHPLYVTMSVCQLQGTLLGAVSVLLPPPEIAAEVRNITPFWVRIPSNNAPCSVWPFPYIHTYIHPYIHPYKYNNNKANLHRFISI